ncbi:hypothetical protein BC828DRAFT_296411 [Blastocladiella britannica]|nr:hypothetical protein BC828DRAFT_296411 [Blastocladiella britannica]
MRERRQFSLCRKEYDIKEKENDMYIQLDLAPQIDRLSLVDHRACAPEHLELVRIFSFLNGPIVFFLFYFLTSKINLQLEAAIYGLEIAVQAASAALATLALPATPQQQQPARADADHDRLLGELSAGLGRLSVSGAQAAAMRKSSFPATTPTPLLAVTSTRRWSDVGRVVPECFPGRIGASGRRSSIRHRTPPRPLQPRSPARSLSPARGSSPLRNLSPLRDISPSPRTLDLSPSPRIRSGIGAPARRRRRPISVLVDSSSSSSASSSDSLLADMDQETPGSPVAKIRRTSAAFPSPSPKTWEAPTGPSIFAVPAAATWPPKAEVVMLSSSEEEVALVEGAAGPIPGRNFGDSDSQWTAAGGDSQVAARHRPRRINQRVARVRELLRMPSRSRFGYLFLNFISFMIFLGIRPFNRLCVGGYLGATRCVQRRRQRAR